MNSPELVELRTALVVAMSVATFDLSAVAEMLLLQLPLLVAMH